MDKKGGSPRFMTTVLCELLGVGCIPEAVLVETLLCPQSTFSLRCFDWDVYLPSKRSSKAGMGLAQDGLFLKPSLPTSQQGPGCSFPLNCVSKGKWTACVASSGCSRARPRPLQPCAL